MKVPRLAVDKVRQGLLNNPAVALLGPRQVGKTTLARDLAEAWQTPASYLDLERPADRRKLADADHYLRSRSGKLLVLDEVHRVPELFEILRGVIDDNRRAGFRNGQFLLLGSASLELINKSSESLAGRMAHVELAGITSNEADLAGVEPDINWLYGGMPDSLTATSASQSYSWREDFIRSYLERDIPMFAPRIPAETLRRLWTMLAHHNSTLFNSSNLAANLGVSSPTITRYVDLLVDLSLIRRLPPWHQNIGKRVTKSPKIMLRDSGILHALLGIITIDDLLGHPIVGQSYESFVVENLISAAGSKYQPYHFRTAKGAEVDLLLVRGGKPEIAIEIKRSSAPKLSPGFYASIADLGVKKAFVVHPGSAEFQEKGVEYRNLLSMIAWMQKEQEH